MDKWADKPAAIIQTFYWGMKKSNAIARVFFGKCPPSGKLLVTFPRCLQDHGSFGKCSQKLVDDKMDVKEDVLVGYRWFLAQDIEPLWGFGFGLSYTNFSLSDVVACGHIFPNRRHGFRIAQK